MTGQTKAQEIPSSFYDFEFTTLSGETKSFAEFKGKKILVVNTASKCGLTPQYEGLEKLHQQYKDELVLVGFPANNFMQQEPGSNEEIAAFCEANYGVSFIMSEKISVKGDDIHPIYQWLTKKQYNGKMDSEVTWNFQKYLIDEKGNLQAVFEPKTEPLAKEIIQAL